MNDIEQVRMLAGRMADGAATREDADRLSALLRDRADLRDEYLAFQATHAALCWQFRSEQGAVRPAPVGAPRRSQKAIWLPWCLTAAALLLMAFVNFRPAEEAPGFHETAWQEPQAAPASGAALIAVLIDEAGAEFAADRGPEGARFRPGKYELRAGVAHLRFANGAEVVLSGPSQWEIIDATHVRLDAGMVRVVAPPTAAGFTMATRTVDYVDLGTEFGLRVEPESGATDLYVFDGQVNVADPQSGKVLTEVYEGSATRHVRGVPVAAPELQASAFPNPSEIGFMRWREFERRMEADPSLLAFFPFERDASDDLNDNLVRNTHQANLIPHGKIVGARWASGRWPGKDALLFDRDDDRVELVVPGEYAEFSVAAWVKVDRLDYELNAIFNSDASTSGGIHFQFTRQGLLRGGLLGVKSVDTAVGNPVPLGRWSHVALVISTGDRQQRIYVNGKLARVRTLLGDGVVRPGPVRLGNWLPATGSLRSERAFRGRMDELSLWSRVLAEAEIVRLYEEGRPRLLWNEQPLELTAVP